MPMCSLRRRIGLRGPECVLLAMHPWCEPCATYYDRPAYLCAANYHCAKHHYGAGCSPTSSYWFRQGVRPEVRSQRRNVPTCRVSAL